MSQDYIKGRGTVRSNKPDAGGANIRSVPVLGIVKDNVDPVRAGRLKVYLTDQPHAFADPDNADNWVTVSYMSNYFGRVRPDAGKDTTGTYKSNPSSYGEWHSPPDIGTTVVCIFINGDPNFGFYIGCVPEPESLYMVPAIGASDKVLPNDEEAETYGGAIRLPVTNINTNNPSIANSPDFISSPRPVHSYSAAIMFQQGILRDPIRGPISSSSQREASSRVGWGISTPGRPIYEGGFDDESVTQNLNPEDAAKLRVVARRGGHSIVMDDGDVIGSDQLIRIRTALGHQILMSDDGQTMMLLHSNGQSYIELGKEGTVDVYSTNSVNIRTHGDLNLHADNDVNIHAGENLNIQGKNIHVNSDDEFKLRAGKDIKASTLKDFTVKASGAAAIESGSDASLVSKRNAFINGSKVNLNSGKASTVPEEVDVIPINAQTDTLYDKQKGYIAAPGKLMSITSRAPAHAPWAAAGQGVDVEVSLNAPDQLPKSPTSSVSAVNRAAANSGADSVSLSTVSSVPTTSPISSSLGGVATGAVLGAVASGAAKNLIPNSSRSVQQGYSVVLDPITRQPVPAVGAFAQTSTQLTSSGILKPGSDRMINAIVQSGAGIKQAMPDSVFTGKTGSFSLDGFVQNIPSQASSLVNNFQQAQTAMVSSGILTGKESPTQVAGLVTSATIAGIGATINAVKQFSRSGTGNFSTDNSASTLRLIGAGSEAARVATVQGGGLGGITSAVSAMPSEINPTRGSLDLSRGIDGSAFDAIKNSFKPLRSGEPQNLSSIAIATSQNGSIGPGDLVRTTNAIAAVGAGPALATGNLIALGSAATAINNGTKLSAASTIASGINNVPGGQKTITALTNKQENLLNVVPGISLLTILIKQARTAVMNGFPGPDIPDCLNTLSTIVSENLTISDVSQLQTAMSAISSGAVGPTKLPSSGVSTNDRSDVANKFASLLGDPGIPVPNIFGVKPRRTAPVDRTLSEEQQELSGLLERLTPLEAEIAKAKADFIELDTTLPAGDPQVDVARNKWFNLFENEDYLETLSQTNLLRGDLDQTLPIPDSQLVEVRVVEDVNFDQLISRPQEIVNRPDIRDNQDIAEASENLSNDLRSISNSISGITGEFPTSFDTE